MENNISTTALVALTVAPAVTTALLAYVTGVLNERRKAMAEHRHWLRQTRYEAYGALLEAAAAHEVDNYRDSIDGMNTLESTKEMLARAVVLLQARHKALLVSDDETVMALTKIPQ